MTAGTEVARPNVEIQDGLVQLTNLDGAYRYAQYLLKSDLVPKSFNTAEKILVAFQHGAELGLTPMQSLQHIGVVNGRPALFGKGVAAVVMKSGLVDLFEESFEGTPGDDTYAAVCKVKRKNIASIRTERFTIADAKKAGIWGKNTWVQYPKDMLMYKARARAFVLFADVLAGLPILEDIAEVAPERAPLIPTGGTPASAPAAPDPLLEKVGIAVHADAVIVPENPPTPRVDEPGDTAATSGLFDSDEFVALKKEMQSQTDVPTLDKWGKSVAKRMSALAPDELIRMRDLYAAMRESLPPTA